MTLEDLEAFRAKLTASEYRMAEMVLSGLRVNDILRRLKIGGLRFKAAINIVEAVLGERIRAGRGHTGHRPPADYELGDEDVSVVAHGDRCNVCGLLEPHQCLDPREHATRAWTGDYPMIGADGRKYRGSTR